jgi:hypothetical protein
MSKQQSYFTIESTQIKRLDYLIDTTLIETNIFLPAKYNTYIDEDILTERLMKYYSGTVITNDLSSRDVWGNKRYIYYGTNIHEKLDLKYNIRLYSGLRYYIWSSGANQSNEFGKGDDINNWEDTIRQMRRIKSLKEKFLSIFIKSD